MTAWNKALLLLTMAALLLPGQLMSAPSAAEVALTATPPHEPLVMLPEASSRGAVLVDPMLPEPMGGTVLLVVDSPSRPAVELGISPCAPLLGSAPHPAALRAERERAPPTAVG